MLYSGKNLAPKHNVRNNHQKKQERENQYGVRAYYVQIAPLHIFLIKIINIILLFYARERIAAKNIDTKCSSGSVKYYFNLDYDLKKGIFLGE